MTSNSPSPPPPTKASLKTSPPLISAIAPPQVVSSNNRLAIRPVGRPPKEVTEDHLQTTIGDGFRVVSKRGHLSAIPSSDSPSSSPPAKVANTREVSSPPSKPADDNDEMGDQDSQDSQPSLEEAQTAHSLLQRLNALEIYVAAQDQRILQLEDIIAKTNTHHQHFGVADPIIKDIQEKIRNIEATPKTSYRDAAAKGIPDLASAVIKEQSERLKRAKSIVIRVANAGPQSILQSPDSLRQDISRWLSAHGINPDDMAGLSARLINRKPSTSSTSSTSSAQSPSTGATVVVTLPSITDRIPIIAHLKRSVRSLPTGDTIYIDPDLTPAEAKEQHGLRLHRNRMNSERSEEDIAAHHFGIRSGRVVKLQH